MRWLNDCGLIFTYEEVNSCHLSLGAPKYRRCPVWSQSPGRCSDDGGTRNTQARRPYGIYIVFMSVHTIRISISSSLASDTSLKAVRVVRMRYSQVLSEGSGWQRTRKGRRRPKEPCCVRQWHLYQSLPSDSSRQCARWCVRVCVRVMRSRPTSTNMVVLPRVLASPRVHAIDPDAVARVRLAHALIRRPRPRLPPR